jgi:hypothetical protein
MGHPDGAHTHGSGGGGLGSALLVVLGAALVVKSAPVVLGAAAELLHVVLIVVFIAACTGAEGVVALLALKCRRARAGAAARTMPPLPPQVVRAAPPLPQERRAGELPRESQRELPVGFIFTSRHLGRGRRRHHRPGGSAAPGGEPAGPPRPLTPAHRGSPRDWGGRRGLSHDRHRWGYARARAAAGATPTGVPACRNPR